MKTLTHLMLCSAAAVWAVPAHSNPAQTGKQSTPIVAQLPQQSTRTVLPANTEVIVAMNDTLSTKGGNFEVGHIFYLTVAADVKIGDYVVIPKGSRAAGEVTWKTGKAVFGKSGKMEIELRYVEVGGQRIQIEGKYRQEGEGNTVAAVGAAILAAPLLFVTGKSATIPKGRELSARTVSDVPVMIPVAAVPTVRAIEAAPAPVLQAVPAAEAKPQED